MTEPRDETIGGPDPLEAACRGVLGGGRRQRIGGRYERLETLGEGATARVYLARDRELGRLVALKEFRLEVFANERIRRRFLREGKALARIAHPHVVQIFDAFEDGGRGYLVLQRIEGRSLHDVHAEGRLPTRRAVEIVEKIARGVDAVHRAGIVHRDIKLENVLVTGSGEPKIADFGLALLSDASTRLTRTGRAVGTPLYMAPEQIRGPSEEITPRTDVYALGVLLYVLLTGRHPFGGRSLDELYGHILHDPVTFPDEAARRLPRDLRQIVLRALAKAAGERFDSAAGLADDLRRHLDGRRTESGSHALGAALRRSRRTTVALAAAAGAVALAVVTGKSLLRDPGVASDPGETPIEGTAGAEEAAATRRAAARRLVVEALPALDGADRALHDESVPVSEVLDRVVDGRRLLERAVDLDPDLAIARYYLGRAWETAGDLGRAEAAWREAIRLDPDLGIAHYRLGRLLLERSFLEKCLQWDRASPRALDLARQAQSALERAIAEGGGFDDRLGRLVAEGTILHLREDFAALGPLLVAGNEEFAGQPGREEILFLFALGPAPMEGRRDALDRALALRPRFPLALLARGQMRQMAGDAEGALVDIARAIELRRHETVYHLSLAEAYGVAGRHAEAMAVYDRMLGEDPDSVLALGGRGSCRLRMGRYREALEDFDRCLEIDPDDLSAHLERGTCLEKAGDLAGALAAFEAAVRIDPLSPTAHLRRGIVRRLSGDRQGAITDWSRVLELERTTREEAADALYLRSYAHFENADVSAARRDSEAALAAAPPDWPRRREAEAFRRHLEGR